MSKILRIACREYMATVKTKGFIIGLALAPILMSGGFVAMLIAEKNVDTTDKKIAVIEPMQEASAQRYRAGRIADQGPL